MSIFETVREVDYETVTKDNNISLKKEPTSSLLSGNVDYSDESNNSLMIAWDVTKTKEYIGQLKYGFVFLLNDV